MGGETEQYRLIIYSNPNDSKSHENRRFVRSHVTKRQHRSLKNQLQSSTNSSSQRNRRRNTDNSSLRQAIPQVAKQIETGLPLFLPPQPAPQELSPVDSLDLLSPTSFHASHNFDDVYTGPYQLSRSGSISSVSVRQEHQQQQHRHQHKYPIQQPYPLYRTAPAVPVSYATPPPEYQDSCHPHYIPRAALPNIIPNDDVQNAYEASILLLKSTGTIAQVYELTLESFACAKISAALLALSTQASMSSSSSAPCDRNQNKIKDQHPLMLPSDGLMRAIAHMAHYDQIAPGRQDGIAASIAAGGSGGSSLFDHHMECLVDCVKRVGGFGHLSPDLQRYVLQVDHAVAISRGSAAFFAVAPGTSPLLSPL